MFLIGARDGGSFEFPLPTHAPPDELGLFDGLEPCRTATSPSADTYLALRNGSGAGSDLVVYNDDSETGTDSRITRTLAAGAYTIEATTFLGGETGQFTLTLVASQSGNSTFTDHPLVAGSTPIRAAHMNELRDRIGGLRLAHDLPGFRWTDVPIQPGVTPVKAVHLMELRAAVDETYAAAGHSGPEYTGATVTAGVTAIRAADIMELREAVQRLESAATPPSGGRDKRRSKGARQR